MKEFEIQGKKFHYPEEITNRMVISVLDLEQSPKRVSWVLDAEDLNKMMRLVLVGPHDEIDWLDVSRKLTKEIYNGFFDSTNPSENASE